MRFVKTLLGSIALLLMLATSGFAKSWSPFSLAIVSIKDSQTPNPEDSVGGLRFSFLCGRHKRMYGLALACIGNGGFDAYGNLFPDGDAAGFQLSGVWNFAETAKYGLCQITGGVNGLTSSKGGEEVRGEWVCTCRICLASSKEGGDVRGDVVQLAGLGNIIGDLNGPETAIASGIQIAGLFNVVNGDFSGVQIGMSNNVKKLYGVQIGVFNLCENICGAQIGLFNIVTSSSDFPFVPILRCAF